MTYRADSCRDFDWKCCPEGDLLFERYLSEAMRHNSSLARFEKKLKERTSSHLLQWVEAVYITHEERSEFEEVGFKAVHRHPLYETLFHPSSHFPYVVVLLDASNVPYYRKISLAVEDLSLFLLVNDFPRSIEGSLMSEKRSSIISIEEGYAFEVSERRGAFSPAPVYISSDEVIQRMYWKDRWRLRNRSSKGVSDEDLLLQGTLHIAEEMVAAIGTAVSASLVLEVEREFWQSKNRAGQIQYSRQNSLGMGWANHDHHTFRSSRRHFQQTCHIFETLGFCCRERFWAGQEAGWGAQVLEHPEARGVIFLDVDLLEEEVGNDFAHMPLPEASHLGTIGLWCALHGESILNAGMHHLEAQFDFSKLKEDLYTEGVHMMAPFSSFSYLQQAFTTGEKWSVDPSRVHYLLEKRLISQDDACSFIEEGAIGSHLENLERKEGYKGFNKNNVSLIIRETDPRKNKLMQ